MITSHEALNDQTEPSSRAGLPDDDASTPFVGQWNRLVSTTNWEKGRIIAQWRSQLEEGGAAATDFSDEAWSRRVGGVTGGHVGRLRRVYNRFGKSREDYDGLYWSHFHAALDWDDAEMWLEGAVQNRWSVSVMRRTRWETLGGAEDQKPQEDQIVSGELDEDFEPALRDEPERQASSAGDAPFDQRPTPEGPDFGDDDPSASALSPTAQRRKEEADEDGAVEGTVQVVRPFEKLGDLPDDVTEAFESFKLAILRHKAEEWKQISHEEMLGVLESLKELALAP